MSYRSLTGEEITLLESRGCHAEDWTRVRAARLFTPGQTFHRVRFSGEVTLGVFRDSVTLPEGWSLPAGIEDAVLHNVSVGDNCVIRSAAIADTDIGESTVLCSVGAVSRSGEMLLAKCPAAAVLAEDGVRGVPLSRKLTAQTAHLICHLKGHPAARALEAMLERDAALLDQPRNTIAARCRIRRTGSLRNVWLGEGTVVEGAASLTDCCAAGSRIAPVHIGEGTAAEECVFLTASSTAGGVRLVRCLVGEGTAMRHAFFGKDSLFFANSEFALGEAACVMAGPFTVSHHRASLLLSCQCSFATFGSTSNSSNHHFKLGARHGGVLRRGVRCGSGSYIFWPSDIGAFSTVVGRHLRHLGTADFPFSLLLAQENETLLVPAVSVFGAGIFRDAAKWPGRDRRGGVAAPADLVNPVILSPYLLQAMDRGLARLDEAEEQGTDCLHGGARIPAGRFAPARKLYRAALVFRMGEVLFSRASAACGGGIPDTGGLLTVIAGASADDPEAEGMWRDWGGMLLPGGAAEAVLHELESGQLADPEAVRTRLLGIHAGYERYELHWLVRRWRQLYGDADAAAAARFAAEWREAVSFRHASMLRDAAKEFAPEVRLGFGVEAGADECFRRVRGFPEDHPLTAQADAERARLLGLAEAIPAVH